MRLNLALKADAGGPFIGPRGGMWADMEHTKPWRGGPKAYGVHLHNDRWHHVPTTAEENDGDTDFADEITGMDREVAERRNRVHDHLDQGTREFSHANSDGDHAVIVPDASEPGRWRYSTFDKAGFSGHRTFDTLRETTAAAADAGYHTPNKGVLGQMFAGAEWAQGSRDTAVMGVINRVGGEAARAAWDFYNREGRTEEARAKIEAAHEELSRGVVPEGLKAQMSLFAGDPSHGGKLTQMPVVNRHGKTSMRWINPESLHRTFGHMGAPAPGEKGHKPLPKARIEAERRAKAALRRAYHLHEDAMAPFVIQAARVAGERHDPDLEVWPDELPSLLGVDLDPVEAADIFFLAAQVRDRSMPLPVAMSIIADMWQPAGKLRLANITPQDAADFIAQHHSEMPTANMRGLMFSVAAKSGGRTVAVATAGSPTGRWEKRIDPRGVLELTRVASDGTTKNASSKLTARMLDLAPKVSGVDDWLFVTYSLASEKGTTYRALRDKGLRPVALVKGKRGGGGGARSGAGQAGAIAGADKIRWEAGTVAMPAKWGLLETRLNISFGDR